MLKKTIEKLFGNLPARKLFSLTLGLTALLATVAGATPGYAESADEENDWLQLSLNPGVQAAIDAGLVTELNQTTRPVIDEANLIDPLETWPEAYKIKELDLAQTIDDVTVTLDWIYKDTGSTTLMLTHSELPAGTRLGMPKFSYTDVYDYGGMVFPDNEIMRVSGNRIIAVAFEVANPRNPDRTTDISIDLPLIKENEPYVDPLSVFHFELNDYIVPEGQGIQLQQTGSVSYDNYEVQMRSVRVMPETSEIVVCYNALDDATSPLIPRNVILEAPALSGNEFEPTQIALLTDDSGLMDQCAQLTFPYGNSEGDASIGLTIRSIGEEEDPAQALTGEWSFYTNIPGEIVLRSQYLEQQQTAASEQPEIDPDLVSIELDWAYLDETRLDFGFHLHGLSYMPEANVLDGEVMIITASGDILDRRWGGYGTLDWSDDESGTIVGYWHIDYPDRHPSAEDLPLTVQITIDGRPRFEDSMSIGRFVQPQIAAAPGPYAGEIIIPQQLIGTFAFDLELPVYPMETRELAETSKVNNIRMRMIGIESTPAGSDITLCYQKPSSADWTFPYGEKTVDLKSETDSAAFSAYEVVYDQDFGAAYNDTAEKPEFPLVPEEGERCVRLHFDLGKTASPQKMSLTIPQLRQSPPDMIPQEELDAIRKPLKELGIEFVQILSTTGGGGGGGFEITAPEGMNDIEAYEEVQRLLGYTYDGPWVFEFELP